MAISLPWFGLGGLGLLAAWALLTAPHRRHRHWLFFWVDEMAVAFSGQALARRHRGTPAANPVTGHLPASLVDARTFSSVDLGGMRLKNRIVRAAAFGGAAIDDLIACHEEVARGGAAMTTVAYACVSADGRTFKQQILLNEAGQLGVRADLTRLASAVHAAGAKVSIQLTHGGGFADPAHSGGRTVAPSCVFNPAAMNFPLEMDPADMERITADFVRSAQLVQEVGFDAVELHCGHGYLLSQFLCPFTNRRTDEYGGVSVENRLRFPLEVLDAVRRAVGPSFPIVVKFNVHDGFEQGISIDDAVECGKSFAAHGASLLVPSGGFVSRNGLYMLRGNVPYLQMVKAMPGITKTIATALLGPLFIPETGFEEAFFRDGARRIKNAVDVPVALIGGVTKLSLVEGALREGFACVQMARALIADPELPNKMRASLLGEGGCSGVDDVQSPCIHCNQCVVATLDPTRGMHCVLRPALTDIEDAIAG